MNGYGLFRFLRSGGRARLAAAFFLVLAGLASMKRLNVLWGNMLGAGLFVLTLSLGAGLFLAVQGVTRASWSRSFHRVPEAMLSLLPWGALFVGAALFMGRHAFYGWAHEGHGAHAGGFREFWLAPSFLLVRAALYLGLWFFAGRALVKPGPGGSPRRGAAAAFLLIFAPTFSLASFDWVMALQPHWFSTMFAVLMFSGAFLAALSAMAVCGAMLPRLGFSAFAMSAEQRHDLGKLIFGFSTFWAYIWFSQFMLVWYSNIPEEVTYFTARSGGGWGVLGVLNVLLHWGVPFVALMPRAAKRREDVLLPVSLGILAGHALDIYLAVMPPLTGAELGPALPRALCWLAVAGWALSRFLRSVESAAKNGPLTA
jgi:hypothetical protein